VVFLLIVQVFVASCNSMNRYGEVVRGKYFEGLIVRYDDSEPIGKSNPPGWTPGKELFLEIEPSLLKYMNSYGTEPYADRWINAHLFEYKLQIYGDYAGERKVMSIWFYHESKVKGGAWKVPFGVLGGGDYFFLIKYDVGSGTFEGPFINFDA
jgi:hypothetical protein